MKKIYLFCSGGMSTSILADKMQKIADSHNIPLEVKAYPESKIEEILLDDNPDCILLGPQVKHMYKQVNDKFGSNYPIEVIDSADYGMMNGEKVLKTAIKMIKTFKK